MKTEEIMLAPIVEIFCDIDDFCKVFYRQQSLKLLPNPDRKRKRECNLTVSEIMTILVLFQLSHYRTFKDFYDGCLLRDLRSYFPRFISYNHFTSIQSCVIPMLTMYMLSKTGQETGIYYVDATTLKVCHNKRISRHKVFEGLAERGKTSMGWFFGFKLHLAVNHKGEIMAFQLTPGNNDDRKSVRQLLKGLKGTAAGDRGYIGKKLAAELKDTGINFLTKARRNMKPKTFTTFEQFVLAGRSIIETIFDQLKALCQIDHTRHRKPDNFLTNLLAAMIAYTLRPRKPRIAQCFLPNLNRSLMQS